MIAAIALIALLGSVVGGLLTVLVHRLPRGQSLISPRARCPSCTAAIAPLDSVPVVSWLLLRGRCRSCRAPISVRYALVELLTAAAFGAVALGRGVTADLALLLPFAATLIAVSCIDLEHRIVPNRILLPAAVWAIVGGGLLRTDELPGLLIAGAAAPAGLLLDAVLDPTGMGMGDVKLAAVMGLYLGASVVPALLLAFLAGSAYGLGRIAREGIEARKAAVPFAPFLALGGLGALIAGPALVDLYAQRLD
jgi:leader peptidase (prepilin peptidase) / N-methyltransferase